MCATAISTRRPDRTDRPADPQSPRRAGGGLCRLRAAELIRRYSQTKRRHPLAPAETPPRGIEREIDLLAPIRVRADHLIDTTEMSPHDLKAELARWFGRARAALSVSLQSFSYKRGVPRGVDMIFDCRFLRNPYWDASCATATGAIRRWPPYPRRPRFAEFFAKVDGLDDLSASGNGQEGKAHLTIGFGCTGGQHRSVAVAEIWPKRLQRLAGRCQNGTGNWNAGRQGAPPLRKRGDRRVIGIVIVAHGGSAREYLSAVEHVVGKQDGMRAIAIEDDHDRAPSRRNLRRRRCGGYRAKAWSW
jgi:hypothetical protein